VEAKVVDTVKKLLRNADGYSCCYFCRYYSYYNSHCTCQNACNNGHKGGALLINSASSITILIDMIFAGNTAYSSSPKRKSPNKKR